MTFASALAVSLWRPVSAFAGRVRRRAERRQGAGRVRHQRRAARALARSHLSLGKSRSRSIRPTPPRSTTSRSPTSTKDSSTRRARRTRKRSSSSRTIRRFVRTTSCSRKSMTARAAERKAVGLALADRAALGRLAAACGPTYFEIPIETPIQPKLDVSAFQRVLVAGFVPAAPTMSTRTRKRSGCCAASCASKSSLQGHRRRRHAARRDRAGSEAPATGPTSESVPNRTTAAAAIAPSDRWRCRRDQGREGSRALRAALREHRVLEADRRGVPEPADRHRHGALHAALDAPGFVQRDVRSIFDSFGRRRVVPVRTYMERKGFILRPKFVFIDGRTGATMYSEELSGRDSLQRRSRTRRRCRRTSS